MSRILSSSRCRGRTLRAVLLGCCLLFAACGQKGPLYLPDAPAADPPAPPQSTPDA